MRPALNHFRQRESLLARITLHLLRRGVVGFELFKLLRIALQYGNHRFKLRQLIAELLNKARGFLRFIQPLLDLIDAIGEGLIRQQAQARQQAVKLGHALFRLLELNAILLVIIFMIADSPLKLAAAAVEGADLRFRIVVKRHANMAADKAAEG